MSVEKIRGIVLKEMSTGESGKRIVVLSREKGKLTLSVNGAKNIKSKHLAATQLFTYSEFVVFQGKGFYSVTQGEVIESFYTLRQDITKLSFCAYILELVEKTMMEAMVEEEVLDLILLTFSVLSKLDFSVLLAVSIFEIKYLQHMGLFGQGDICSKCGVELNRNVCFSANEGLVCVECQRHGAESRCLLNGTYATLRYVLQNAGKRLFAFQVSKAVEEELRMILEDYVTEHLEQRFLTLGFAKECFRSLEEG